MRVPVASMQGGLLTRAPPARPPGICSPAACNSVEGWTLAWWWWLATCRAPSRTRTPLGCGLRWGTWRPGPAAWHSRGAGVPGSAGLGNNLQTAAALVHDVGDPWLGICLDTFHFAVGPSKTEDLACLTQDNLFHVHISDLADRLRERATDRDRILPGDGDLPLATIVRRLRALDYQGGVSVEIMNPQIWQIPARQVADASIAAIRRVLQPQ